MRRIEVVGYDVTGTPYVVGDEGHLVPIDEITENWALVTSDGVSWVEVTA